MRIVHWVAIMIFLTFSCKKDRCLKGAGEILTEERSLSHAVKIISLESKIHLVITQDSGKSLLVQAGENLLPHIETELTGDTLFIFNKNRCDWLRSYKKEIHVYFSGNDLQKIIYKGDGNISSTHLIKADTFEIEQFGASGTVDINLESQVFKGIAHTGSADMIISGLADRAYLYSTATGPLDCSGLKSNVVNATNSSAQAMRLYAKQELRASIQSSGDIYYEGEPSEIVVNITGTGQLIPKN